MSDTVSRPFFIQCIFLILVSSPSSRLSALNFLTRKMLKPPNLEQDKMDVGLIIRGVSATLHDESVLVRRTALDLLLRILPLTGEIAK